MFPWLDVRLKSRIECVGLGETSVDKKMTEVGRISYYTIYKIKEGTVDVLLLVVITIFMNIYCENN